ncbi:hypothetical protein HRED_07886 [Candidatus Haloredivivus sp. G17]|nr:hypothetical protein HRED_07886 [Candidatus Haloredivivus sp. G17]
MRRTYDLAEEVDEAPSSVEIIDYENKWGENQNGDIRLHWRLIMATSRNTRLCYSP